jgi:hypothetical protein
VLEWVLPGAGRGVVGELPDALGSWGSGSGWPLAHQRLSDEGTPQSEESASSASERATENMPKLCYININSLLLPQGQHMDIGERKGKGCTCYGEIGEG